MNPEESRHVRRPHGAGSEIELPRLGAEPTAREVLRLAIAKSARRLNRNLPGVRSGVHPEPLHQARVATRRLRTQLRIFSPILDDEWAQGLVQELQTAGDVFGRVRDIDVLLMTITDIDAEMPGIDDAGVNPLISHLVRDRLERRQVLLDFLDGEAMSRLLSDLVSASRDPRTDPLADRRAAEVLPRVTRRPWRRLERAVNEVTDASSTSDLHRIRILAKRCRYTADAVRPIVGKRTKEFAAAMSRIQDCLGDLNDAMIIGAALEEAAAEDPELGFTAGRIAGVLLVRAERKREQFPAIWKDVSDKRLRDWW